MPVVVFCYRHWYQTYAIYFEDLRAQNAFDESLYFKHLPFFLGPSSRSPTGNTAVATGPCLMIIAFALYGWYTFSGPYRWLADLQIGLFGAYGVIITGILTGLIFLWPLAFVGARLEQRGFLTHEATGMDYDPKRHDLPTGLLTLSLMALAAGWFSSQRIPRGEPVPITLEEIGNGAVIPAHVSLQGQALVDASLRLEGDGGNPTYAPLVAEGYEAGTPIVVFVESHSRDERKLAATTHKGVLIRNGLPGVIREGFKSTTNTPPAEPHFLFCYGSATDGLEFLPWVLFGAAGVLGLASIVLLLMSRQVS